MKEIFFISQSLPRFGGYKRRVDTAMKLLKKLGKVRYYYFTERKDVVPMKGAIKLPEATPAEKVLNILLNEGSFRLRTAPNRAALEFMRKEVSKRNPSLIYAHNMSAIMLASDLKVEVPMVFDFTDELSLKFRQISKASNSPITSLFSLIDSWIVGNLELEFRDDALGLYITSRDLKASAFSGRKMVLPNLPPKPQANRTKKKYDLFTAGNYLYPPNARMVKAALELRGKHTLLIVGKGAHVSEEEGVHYKGVVKDYWKEISKAKTGFFPLDVAMGLQNKVLDSFAVGNPAIISKQVEEGLADFLEPKHRSTAVLEEFTKEEAERCYGELTKDYEGASEAAREALENYRRLYERKTKAFLEYVSSLMGKR